jgi:hypothetical protein
MPPSPLSQDPHPQTASATGVAVSLLPGTMPCGCTGSNAGDARCAIAQLLPLVSVAIEANRTLGVAHTTSFISNAGVSLTGASTALGSTIVMQSSAGVPLGHATVQVRPSAVPTRPSARLARSPRQDVGGCGSSCSPFALHLQVLRPRRAVAHLGGSSNALVGNITLEQTGPWSAATLSVDVVGDRTLDDWFISHAAPAIGTDPATGAPSYSCPSSLVFNPASTATSRARRGNRGAGSLTGQVGGLRCGDPSGEAGWLCNSDGTRLDTARTRTFRSVGLSAYGTDSIVGHAVVVVRPGTNVAPICAPLTVEDPFRNSTRAYAASFANGPVRGEVKVVEAVDSALAETTVYANLTSPGANSLQLTYTGTDTNVCVVALGMLTCVGPDGTALHRNTGDVIDVPLVRDGTSAVVDSLRIQVYPSGAPGTVLEDFTLNTACVAGSELQTGAINARFSVRTTPCRDWYIALPSVGGGCGATPYNPYVLFPCRRVGGILLLLDVRTLNTLRGRLFVFPFQISRPTGGCLATNGVFSPADAAWSSWCQARHSSRPRRVRILGAHTVGATPPLRPVPPLRSPRTVSCFFFGSVRLPQVHPGQGPRSCHQRRWRWQRHVPAARAAIPRRSD